MARGNLIQGYGRGKLGSTVYSISHGVQVSRVYNPAKYDRKSDAQIIRRAQWIAASQFYSRALAAQFKFAFENKKPNASEQNIFMKLNWDRGVIKSYDQVSDPNCPSVGRFIISNGSLKPLQVISNTSTPLCFIVPAQPQGQTGYNTLGYMSRCLIAQGYRSGDILTYTAINTDALAGSNQQPIVTGAEPPVYNYIQVRLDPESTISLSAINISFEESGDDIPEGYVGFNADLDIDQFAIGGGAIQMSRQLRNRLLVSYAEIVLNPEANAAFNYGLSQEWRQIVIDSWKTTGDALLQGTQVENSSSRTVNQVTSDLTFPRTWASMNTKAIVTKYITNPHTFCEKIVITDEAGNWYRYALKNDNSILVFIAGSNGGVAIIRQDSTDPHRWVCQSDNVNYQVGSIFYNNM